MNELSFEKYCTRLKLSRQAIAYITRVRAADPARNVGGGRGNVTVRFPSEKMGCVIQAESHTCELALVYLLEHDPATYEFYDQPPRIQLNYKSATGRTVAPPHTPDYFVLSESGVTWIECKTASELEELAVSAPGRYLKAEKGFVCPPGEAFAKELGFSYRIFTPAENNYILLDNLRLLRDYFSKDCPIVDKQAAEAIAAAVQEHPGTSIRELMLRADFSIDHLYAMIAAGKIYADLSTTPLARHEMARLYRDQHTSMVLAATLPSTASVSPISLKVGAEFLWKETVFTIANLAGETLFLTSPEGKIIPIAREEIVRRANAKEITGLDSDRHALQIAQINCALKNASPEDVREAHRRKQIIDGVLAADINRRTLNRWKRLFRRAEHEFENGIIGLLPNTRKRGNRTERHDEALQKLADSIIDSDYNSAVKKTKLASFGLFLLECKNNGLVPAPSYKWFARQIQKRTAYQKVRARDGKRAAYQVAPQQHENLDRNHGQYPWDRVHIDHTQCDIELVCAETAQNLGRPWLSLMIDGFSRRVLAFYLTFDSPSYRSCMMLLRRCVQEHNRLPATLVVDGGKEFHSEYFGVLTAWFKLEVAKRPPAHARYGAPVERSFGTINTEFLYKLVGNTQVTRNVRQVTKSNNPKNSAVWTLETVHDLLSQYFSEFYFRAFHTGINTTPEEAYARGMQIGGERLHKVIPYNDDFICLTMPSTRRGEAKIIQSKGLKLRGFYYWHDSMSDVRVEGTKVKIKYDPMNISVAYAFISNQWVKCHSRHKGAFDGRTEKQWSIVTEERRRRSGSAHKFRDLRAQEAAALFRDARSTELELQVLKDAAQRRIDAGKKSGPLQAGERVIQFPAHGVVECAAPPAQPSFEPPQDGSTVRLLEQF